MSLSSPNLPLLSLLLQSCLALVVLSVFGGELLDPLKVPGIWFPFGIGVSRTQYIYAVLIPLLGALIARTLAERPSPIPSQAGSAS